MATLHAITEEMKDGRLLNVVNADHLDWGWHLMGYNAKRSRWEGIYFAPMGKRKIWWDENQPQPTHYLVNDDAP